jgi:hypothetical protein
MVIVQGSGSAATGNSGMSVEAGSEATTDTYVIRVIDVVDATSYVSGGSVVYPELIVKINVAQFDRPTGV